MKHVRRSQLIALFVAGVSSPPLRAAFAAEPAQEAEPAVERPCRSESRRRRASGAHAAATPPAANRDDAQDASAPASAPATGARNSAAPRAGAARADRLELDTTVVTGNRELPKVLYIVPWKKADIGDLPAQPFNTLLDEVLTPVDRDVFRREVTYYEAVSSGGDAGGEAACCGLAARPEK